ncbi:Syntaxin-binding protein 2 [Dictyocoela muelleri]|nr:Syntaxin-binding protein 2 [Dictyocoela muelleri]
MNIKKYAKSNFLNLIHQGHSKDQWRILILDNKTKEILESLINLNDLLGHDILIIQNLFDKREKTTYPGIYFVQMNEKSKNQIKKDIKKEIYTSFKIFCINDTYSKTSLNSSKKSSSNSFNNSFFTEPFSKASFSVHKQSGIKFTKIKVEYEMSDLCFTFKRGVILCNLQMIVNFCRVINVNPNIHLALEDGLFVDKSVGEKLNEVFSNKPRVSDLLIFDRRLDVFTPLVHFYTFQSILHDYNLIDRSSDENKKCKDESVEGPIWEKAKYIHLAEINEFLSEKAKKLMSRFKKIDQAESKDLGKLVLEAPENIKIKENLNKLLDLTDKALNIYEMKGELIGTYEMDIVNGFTVKNKKVSIHNLLKIITDPEITEQDKTRLLLLMKSTRGIDDIKSEIESTGMFGNLDWLDNIPHQKPKKAKKYKYEISRYTPKIQKVLNHFFTDKKKIHSFSVTDTVSLRRKGFHFKTESKKILLLYFINGVTYEELRICSEVGDREGVNIVVMSNELITHREFIENLKSGEL